MPGCESFFPGARRLYNGPEEQPALTIASDLRKKTDYIIAENKKDLAAAEKDGVGKAMYDRLLLNRERIEGMAVSIEEIALHGGPHRAD